MIHFNRHDICEAYHAFDTTFPEIGKKFHCNWTKRLEKLGYLEGEGNADELSGNGRDIYCGLAERYGLLWELIVEGDTDDFFGESA